MGRILPSGECSIKRVAATLDLHPRMLQKRLQNQGDSYGKLLKETRIKMAEQQLDHGAMSATDLVLNLGYAEVSVTVVLQHAVVIEAGPRRRVAIP